MDKYKGKKSLEGDSAQPYFLNQFKITRQFHNMLEEEK